MRPILALLAALAWPNAATAQPSFDCGRAATPTEHAICGAPALGALDVRMVNLYRAQVPTGLTDTQRIWLSWRDTCGSEVPCLIRRYEQRILDLDEGAASGDLTTTRIRDGRMERIWPDGTIRWRDLETGETGIIKPDGSAARDIRAQVDVIRLPPFPEDASAWVGRLESDVLGAVYRLLPSQHHREYETSMAPMPLPDRMFRHIETIRFLAND